MQRLIKFLHTMGAIGMAGSMASLIVLAAYLPPPQQLAQYAALRSAMGGIADWIFLPSLAITVLSGLLAFAFTKAFQRARWALVKLLGGAILFEGSLIAVHGPMRREADLSKAVLDGTAQASELGTTLSGEWIALWVMLAVATANVVLGVWRPRLGRGALSRREDADDGTGHQRRQGS